MDKITDISERISKVIDYLNVSKNDFANKLAYSRSQSIYDITNGKSKPSFDFFYRFVNSEYSEIINFEWIVAEKGEMLKSDNENSQKKANPEEIIALQKKIIALQEGNILLKDENIKLQKDNFKLKEENLKMKAALGDDAVRAIA